MSLYQVNAGDRILAADSVQFYNILKGVAASGENILLIYNAGALTFQPSSDPSAGTRVLTIKNNAGTTLFSARYDGLLELLAAAAAPASPVVGSIYFDTLLKFLRVHDGTNWVSPSDSPQPNLVLNSDFSRRTVFGLAMPEVFADTSGYQKLDAGAAPTVGANILTQGAANNNIFWGGATATSGFLRDGRFSATFKAVATAGTYEILMRQADTSSNYIRAYNAAGTFALGKVIAGSPTVVASVAQAMTLNRWYWLEIEAQGTTFIVKMYDTGGTVPGVTKASSTLLQTLTGTISDAGVAVGGLSIRSDQAAAQWGGIATGNGGVYYETWLPELWAVTFGGTLGGQLLAYDEAADSGPLSQQPAMRSYTPNTSRSITAIQTTPDGSVAFSTAYAASFYQKVSGYSGTGALVRILADYNNSADVNQFEDILSSASETTWTRKSAVRTVGATVRRAKFTVQINGPVTAAGTAWFSLPQLEQGSAATAWRNAPADDAPIVWELFSDTSGTTTSVTAVEADSRDLAGNLFLPWDANVLIELSATHSNSASGNAEFFNPSIDGTSLDAVWAVKDSVPTLNLAMGVAFARRTRQAAGKHRFALLWAVSAGTGTLAGATARSSFRVIATRGK